MNILLLYEKIKCYEWKWLFIMSKMNNNVSAFKWVPITMLYNSWATIVQQLHKLNNNWMTPKNLLLCKEQFYCFQKLTVNNISHCMQHCDYLQLLVWNYCHEKCRGLSRYSIFMIIRMQRWLSKSSYSWGSCTDWQWN